MSMPCPKSEGRFTALQRKMDAHDVAKTASKLFGSRPTFSLISRPKSPLTNNAPAIPKTVTFDDSPEEKTPRRRSKEEEEKKQDEDDDMGGSSTFRTPFSKDTMMSFGTLEESHPAVINGGSSPDTTDDTPSPHRLSPFRLKASEIKPLSSSELIKTSLIATPSSAKNDSYMHDTSYRRYPSTAELFDSFGHNSAGDDANEEECSIHSPLTTFQSNAIDLAEHESRCYIQRITQLEDQLEETKEEAEELKRQLERSQTIVQELRDDLVEEEDRAKLQAEKLFQAFQSKLKSLAESFHARADVLDEKQEWAKTAIDMIVQDVEFSRLGGINSLEREDSVSQLSETMHSESENDFTGFENHLKFLNSPIALTTEPEGGSPKDSAEAWMVEKAQLLQELANTTADLELLKAESDTMKNLLSRKDDAKEIEEFRSTIARQMQQIAELQHIVDKTTSQCREVQIKLVEAQSMLSGNCRPTKPARSRWLSRTKAKHTLKAPSPSKSPLKTPNKLLKDTILMLRSQKAVAESKQSDLTASLQKLRKECQFHQMTASKLANELGKVKDELKSITMTSSEQRLKLTAKISILEREIKDQASELELAHTSSKMALKEKGQLRHELDQKVAELEQFLLTEKQVASKMEQACNQSERKYVYLARQLQELQELDKQSAVFIAELKGRITQIERENIELERQKSVLGAQVAAYEQKIRELGSRFDKADDASLSSVVNLQHDKDRKLQRIVGILEERLSHGVELESQLTCTEHHLSQVRTERNVLLGRLENIADRLLRVHDKENDKNDISHSCTNNELLLMDRIEELMHAERELETTKAELGASSARASELWTKCIRWETIYDRDIRKLRAAQSELRRFQTIAKERTIQNTIQRQKTYIEKQRAAALAVSCQNQQRELDNIAAALFDGKP